VVAEAARTLFTTGQVTMATDPGLIMQVVIPADKAEEDQGHITAMVSRADLQDLKVIPLTEVTTKDLIHLRLITDDHQAALVAAVVSAAVVADQVAAVVEVEVTNKSKNLNEKIHTTNGSSYSRYYR